MKRASFATLAAYAAGALALPTPVLAQCAGGLIPNCPAAVSPQPSDVGLLWQFGQSPHQRSVTLAQMQGAAVSVPCAKWDSSTTVSAVVTPCFVASYIGSITSMTAYTNGSSTPSFSASITIDGVALGGCSNVMVSSSLAVVTACTSGNSFTAGQQINVTTGSISGSPQQALVQINFN